MNVVGKNSIIEKIRLQIRSSERMEQLQEEIFLDILDGQSSGDPLLDFVLVSCDGVYDAFLIKRKYRELLNLGITNQNQELIVVKYTESWDKDCLIILRDIHLAVLRKAKLVTDIDSLSMRLPVEPGHFVHREFFKENMLISVDQILSDDWLITGPLFNIYSGCGESRKDENGVLVVPEEAVCFIELWPNENLSLFEECGVDKEMLYRFHTTWIRGKRISK